MDVLYGWENAGLFTDTTLGQMMPVICERIICERIIFEWQNTVHCDTRTMIQQEQRGLGAYQQDLSRML